MDAAQDSTSPQFYNIKQAVRGDRETPDPDVPLSLDKCLYVLYHRFEAHEQSCIYVTRTLPKDRWEQQLDRGTTTFLFMPDPGIMISVPVATRQLSSDEGGNYSHAVKVLQNVAREMKSRLRSAKTQYTPRT